MSDQTYCRGGPPWPPGVELDLGHKAWQVRSNAESITWATDVLQRIEFRAGRPRRAAPTVHPEWTIL
jgi:hypothetical protein